MISVIICTCNRAESLRETLQSMADVKVPSVCELLVVDNGSTDRTPEVVRDCGLSNFDVRYLREPRKGQARARNTGMETARGDIIVFTDDDVRPTKDWISGICAPILAGNAEAVAGGVTIAPHLLRPWMKTLHLGRLACTDWMLSAGKVEMVGANMAFSRDVLKKVPAFDPELGPGAAGFGDDSLFSWQLREAGFRLMPALDVVVEHHFEAVRLTRKSFEDTARKFGSTRAYQMHHWEHSGLPIPHLRLLRSRLRLAVTGSPRNHGTSTEEGINPAQSRLIEEYQFRRAYLNERRRPRNYQLRGLVKLGRATSL